MIEGVLHRDETKWEAFYFKYRRLVVYLGRCMRLSDQDIEELTSRVMVKFSKQEDKFQYDPNKQFHSYFARIVHSVAMDMFREKKRYNSMMAEWPTDEEGHPMDFAGCQDIESALREHESNEVYAEAKKQLQILTASTPEKYRCWQLNREEGWPIKKIVDYLGLPQSTVYWNISDITRKLAHICGELTHEAVPVEQENKPSEEKNSAKHIDQGKILQYIYNECGYLARRHIEGHLKKCPECAALEAELRKQLAADGKLLASAKQYALDTAEVDMTMSRFHEPQVAPSYEEPPVAPGQ